MKTKGKTLAVASGEVFLMIKVPQPLIEILAFIALDITGVGTYAAALYKFETLAAETEFFRKIVPVRGFCKTGSSGSWGVHYVLKLTPRQVGMLYDELGFSEAANRGRDAIEEYLELCLDDIRERAFEWADDNGDAFDKEGCKITVTRIERAKYESMWLPF